MRKLLLLLALAAVWPACAASEEKPELVESWEVTKSGHKVHYWKKASGTVIRAEFDMNDDGKTDKIQISDNHGTTTDAIDDRNFDGLNDQWKYFHCAGKVYRLAEDSNKDGLPDVYMTYERLDRAKVIHEWDRNFDKKIDRRAYQVRPYDAIELSNKPGGKKKVGTGRRERNSQPKQKKGEWTYFDVTTNYHTVWEERDDDFDGVTDYYFNEQEPGKKRVGFKFNTKATVPDRFLNLAGKKAKPGKKSESHVDRMNDLIEEVESQDE